MDWILWVTVGCWLVVGLCTLACYIMAGELSWMNWVSLALTMFGMAMMGVTRL